MRKGKLLSVDGPFQVSVREYEIPQAAEDGMVIKTEAALICGSDGHYIKMAAGGSYCGGHEFVGKIVDMGEKANQNIYSFGGELKRGDRIVIYPHITCGHCKDCLTFGMGTCGVCENDFLYGSPYSCTYGPDKLNTNPDSYPHFKGGFGEYVYIFPGTYVWKVPEGMASELAALLDPVAVAVRAIEMCMAENGAWAPGISTSSRVLVIGAGPIGIICAMILKHMGVQQVIITDQMEHKLELAKNIAHVNHAVNLKGLSEEERIHKILRMTDGGANIVLQCANSINATIEGLQMVKKMGTYIEVGVTKSKFTGGIKKEIDIPKLFFEKNAKIAGLIALNPGTYQKAFDLLLKNDELRFDKLITHHFCNLEEYIDVIKKMGDDDYLKAAYIPE